MIPELATVRTLIAAPGIPAGSIGTVVHVYGNAYEVEFTFGEDFESHWHAVGTYEKDQVLLA